MSGHLPNATALEAAWRVAPERSGRIGGELCFAGLSCAEACFERTGPAPVCARSVRGSGTRCGKGKQHEDPEHCPKRRCSLGVSVGRGRAGGGVRPATAGRSDRRGFGRRRDAGGRCSRPRHGRGRKSARSELRAAGSAVPRSDCSRGQVRQGPHPGRQRRVHLPVRLYRPSGMVRPYRLRHPRRPRRRRWRRPVAVVADAAASAAAATAATTERRTMKRRTPPRS